MKNINGFGVGLGGFISGGLRLGGDILGGVGLGVIIGLGVGLGLGLGGDIVGVILGPEPPDPPLLPEGIGLYGVGFPGGLGLGGVTKFEIGCDGVVTVELVTLVGLVNILGNALAKVGVIVEDAGTVTTPEDAVEVTAGATLVEPPATVAE